MSSFTSTLDVLRTIIRLLDTACARDGWNRPPHLVGLPAFPNGPDDAIDLALRPLPAGVHPLAVLDGMVAPPEWRAIGIVAEGRTVEPPGRARGGRARVIELVARDGTRVAAVRPKGGSLAVYEPPMTNDVGGEIPMALCRAVGVPVIGGRIVFPAAASAGGPAAEAGS